MTKPKRFASIVEAIRDIPDAASHADALERRIRSRQLIKLLVTLRATKEKSQGDIAASMGCTQSRISKLEAGVDGDLRVSDLDQYLKAIGVTPQLVLFTEGATLVDRVKFHFAETARLLDKMLDLLGNDATMAEGVGKFFHETGFNFVSMVSKRIGQLPEEAQRLPWLTVADEDHLQADEVACDQESVSI